MSVHDNTVKWHILAVLWLSQVPQIMFRRSGQSYENATQTIANDLDDWENLYRSLEIRVELYADDWEDHVNFEVIWKCSKMTETIRTIKGYPRIHHYLIIPLIENIFGLNAAEVRNNFWMFTSRMGAIWN